MSTRARLILLAVVALFSLGAVGVAATRPIDLISDGDSITTGFGLPATTNYPDLTVGTIAPLGSNVTQFPVGLQLPIGFGTHQNVATGAITFQTMLANEAANVLPQIATGLAANQRPICSGFGGTNDFFLDASATPGFVFGIATSYFGACKEAGATYAIGWTILPRHLNATFEVQRTSYNTVMRAGFASIGVDFLVDVGADPSMGNFNAPGNATLYQADQTHPTALGQQILADYYAATVGAIGSPITITGISPSSASISGAPANVTITGGGFLTGAAASSVTVVNIGGIRPSSFTIVSPTTITAVTSPAFFPGPGPVIVIQQTQGGALAKGLWTWTP